MADNKVKFLRGTSNEYAVAEKDNDTIYFTTDDGKLYIGDKEISGNGSITIDTELSDTSENVPQTKIVKKALDEKADKIVATTTADGLMSAEDKTKLDGADDKYALKSEIPTALPANGGNADTVNGHTVDADVPADAVFTDTVPDLSLYALKSKYGNTTINIGRKYGTTVGDRSVAVGYDTTASGYYSHAEGSVTTASGTISHAEGYDTTASGSHSHAEGYDTTASQDAAHAEGYKTTASGYYSHTEGSYTTSTNHSSHASGKFNTVMTDGGDLSNTVGTAFVIGNGTGETTLSNAFSVQFNGTVKAKSTITASTTADYAEFFEWLDGNPNGEDRVGYFVTLDGNKIKIASPDDYILGVVSGEPFVLGNGDCDTWNNMFLRDEFRRTIYEPAPKIKEVDGELVEIEGEFEGTRPKLNPEYDHTQRYISRFDRPEWAPIGMLGVLAVRHDGTARVNGYVTIADGGLATACDRNAENSYRVIKSNSDSVVEIIFR